MADPKVVTIAISEIGNMAHAKGRAEFFNPERLAYFHARIDKRAWSGPGGIFFVWQEQKKRERRHAGESRRYVVWRFDSRTGEVTRAEPETSKKGSHGKWQRARDDARKRAETLPESALAEMREEFGSYTVEAA
jgi:hypothetical protein